MFVTQNINHVLPAASIHSVWLKSNKDQNENDSYSANSLASSRTASLASLADEKSTQNVLDSNPLKNIDRLDTLLAFKATALPTKHLLNQLSRATNLLRLDLSFTGTATHSYRIDDISVLANCIALQKVRLIGHLIVDPRPLSNCKLLQEVELSRNLIQSVTWISECLSEWKALYSVSFAQNPVCDELEYEQLTMNMNCVWWDGRKRISGKLTPTLNENITNYCDKLKSNRLERKARFEALLTENSLELGKAIIHEANEILETPIEFNDSELQKYIQNVSEL